MKKEKCMKATCMIDENLETLGLAEAWLPYRHKVGMETKTKHNKERIV